MLSHNDIVDTIQSMTYLLNFFNYVFLFNKIRLYIYYNFENKKK